MFYFDGFLQMIVLWVSVLCINSLPDLQKRKLSVTKTSWLKLFRNEGLLRRKGQNFEDDCIGHCENKVHVWMCLIMNGYRDRAVGISNFKGIVEGNKKEKFLTVNLILIECLNKPFCYIFYYYYLLAIRLKGYNQSII